MKLSLHICYDFKEGPWGGSNQFATAFREFLISEKCYELDPSEADVILFISHANIEKVVSLKRKFPNKLFVHRLDGPIILHNPVSNKRDAIAYWANRNIADATVFQSSWSRRSNYEMGFWKSSNETIILNACSPTVFNRNKKAVFAIGRKTKVIITSWSSFESKGFKAYQWLDQHLDFSKYEVTFVGNSPVIFRHIRILEPMASVELAQELWKHDIYITASEKDACSNSLIEALSCGLPAIALNDGGHPELVKSGGKLFDTPGEIPHLLDQIRDNYALFQRSIKPNTLNVMGNEYWKFINSIHQSEDQKTKNLSVLLVAQFLFYKLIGRF